MITENVSTLKIHKLTQEQYDTALAAGNLDENALYLTPNADGTLTIANVEGLQEALNAKAPSYIYGTADLVAGTSTLETGRLYFVYEDGTSDGGGSSVAIEFVIEGVWYTATEGMTWEEWINSSYNTGSYVVDGDYVTCDTGFVLTDSGDYVSPTDTIINNHKYTTDI